MSIVFNDTTDEQGLVQDLYDIVGNIGIKKATRYLNFALDWYSELAVQSSGFWKYDDGTNTTKPRATATLTEGQPTYRMEAEFLMIDEVEVYYNNEWHALEPISPSNDARDRQISSIYAQNGKPTRYSVVGRHVTLYCAPDSDVISIRVWFSRASNHFSITDTTTTIGIPSTHVQYLSLYASHRCSFKTNNKNRGDLKNEILLAERSIKDFYATREMNVVPTLVPRITVSE